MPSPFQRAYPPHLPAPGNAYWLPFRGDAVLVQASGRQVALIQGDDSIQAILKPETVHYIGTLHDIPCLTCIVDSNGTGAIHCAPPSVLPKDWHAFSLRELFGRLDQASLNLVGYASQLLKWQRISRYCPVCGHLTEAVPNTWGRHCPNCGYVSYPPVTPAILALVYDGTQVLLTHKPDWDKRYSCIAGFVEPGETFEECVQREVYEEVGLEVTDVSYIGSQSWPFPHQIMVGYVARYASGEIRLEEQELDDAQWFSIDALPQLPPPQSLATHIIRTWVDRCRAQ